MNAKWKWTTMIIAAVFIVGCGSTPAKEDKGFYTSGSREADQRAEQRMARAQQNSGESQKDNKPNEKVAAEDTKKLTLYERLGGEKGITAVVDDFVPRALADPRVNFARKGVTRGGLSFHRGQSVEWNSNSQNVAMLKKHMIEFFSVASGGPVQYSGKEIRQAHQGMHISNAEFEACVGDLKQTLDKLQVPNPEQKELLSIVESTRPQIVEEH